MLTRACVRVHVCLFLRGGQQEYQVVDLRGEEERVEEGRQKINQKLLYTKDPKKIH